MIFVPPIVLSDRRLTLRQLRTLMAIMQWRKKNTNVSCVKRKILSDITGYPVSRISTATTELETLGWIQKHGNGGKGIWLRYEILVPDQLQSIQTSHNFETHKGSQNGYLKVSDSDSQTVTNEVTPINTVINTDKSHSNDACELFIDNYPIRVQAKEIRQNWDRLDKALKLTININEIIQDIENRLKSDRGWKAGYIPNPMKYLEVEYWYNEIRPEIESKRNSVPDWAKLPMDDDELWKWARVHGYSDPGDLTYRQYRVKLNSEVQKKLEEKNL